MRRAIVKGVVVGKAPRQSAIGIAALTLRMPLFTVARLSAHNPAFRPPFQLETGLENEMRHPRHLPHRAKSHEEGFHAP